MNQKKEGACLLTGSFFIVEKGISYFYDAPAFAKFLSENDTAAGRQAERNTAFQLVAVI